MKFTRISNISGDETALYRVTEYKAKTVAEFIDEVLKNKAEWGYFTLELPNKNLRSFEYRWGKLLEEIPNEWLNIRISKIGACGGWSRMDFRISGGRRIKNEIIEDLKEEIESFSDFANLQAPQREVEFIAYYFANWQKEHTISKACEWVQGFMKYSPLFEYLVPEDSQKEVIDELEEYLKGEK